MWSGSLRAPCLDGLACPCILGNGNEPTEPRNSEILTIAAGILQPVACKQCPCLSLLTHSQLELSLLHFLLLLPWLHLSLGLPSKPPPSFPAGLLWHLPLLLGLLLLCWNCGTGVEGGHPFPDLLISSSLLWKTSGGDWGAGRAGFVYLFFRVRVDLGLNLCPALGSCSRHPARFRI